MTNSFKSVSEIPVPDNLSDLERIEFNAYKQALVELEQEWLQLKNGENPDQKACQTYINDIKTKRIQQAQDRLNLRKEIIEKQAAKEKERILQQQEDYKKLLFERIIKSYHQSYNTVTSQLKELMDKDYGQFIAQNGITFPDIHNEQQVRTRMSQPEEPKIRLSSAESEQDVRLIQQILQNAGQ
ncbi:hypothetical protein TVAG_499690 [Trichomonas vaginalis G3]|uniref:Uncharacterized protein n=1 Tax=Trichomonas vaginalis (strain ATCC PRA-98 / G3) TaxID=412133 RepID=A2EIQ4_TRIV3|nr:hypothetical protein TVAGG3_0959860 [Trichomonas vaginalis G3]EAY07481.1 hypothetical protein TVAG_499690 [Trichomonas vaginalis G3]KAI5487823.1 hypothetical protein TVAGG3_0959860 [Trichomonas vaginalis G3]|eukprot:XP_001319704.1 hypothetical protein [Trichomonas vaginalis G3]